MANPRKVEALRRIKANISEEADEARLCTIIEDLSRHTSIIFGVRDLVESRIFDAFCTRLKTGSIRNVCFICIYLIKHLQHHSALCFSALKSGLMESLLDILVQADSHSLSDGHLMYVVKAINVMLSEKLGRDKFMAKRGLQTYQNLLRKASFVYAYPKQLGSVMMEMSRSETLVCSAESTGSRTDSLPKYLQRSDLKIPTYNIDLWKTVDGNVDVKISEQLQLKGLAWLCEQPRAKKSQDVNWTHIQITSHVRDDIVAALIGKDVCDNFLTISAAIQSVFESLDVVTADTDSSLLGYREAADTEMFYRALVVSREPDEIQVLCVDTLRLVSVRPGSSNLRDLSAIEALSMESIRSLGSLCTVVGMSPPSLMPQLTAKLFSGLASLAQSMAIGDVMYKNGVVGLCRQHIIRSTEPEVIVQACSVVANLVQRAKRKRDEGPNLIPVIIETLRHWVLNETWRQAAGGRLVKLTLSLLSSLHWLLYDHNKNPKFFSKTSGFDLVSKVRSAVSESEVQEMCNKVLHVSLLSVPKQLVLMSHTDPERFQKLITENEVKFSKKPVVTHTYTASSNSNQRSGGGRYRRRSSGSRRRSSGSRYSGSSSSEGQRSDGRRSGYKHLRRRDKGLQRSLPEDMYSDDSDYFLMEKLQDAEIRKALGLEGNRKQLHFIDSSVLHNINPTDRNYTLGEQLDLVEDQTTHLHPAQLVTKIQHRNIAPVICGIVNSGYPGSVMIGVSPSGVVRGVEVFRRQRDELRIGLDDLLNRFNPKLTTWLYQLMFHPVRASPEDYSPTTDESGEDLAKRLDKYVANLWVIEIRINPSYSSMMYFTPDEGRAYLRMGAKTKQIPARIIQEFSGRSEMLLIDHETQMLNKEIKKLEELKQSLLNT